MSKQHILRWTLIGAAALGLYAVGNIYQPAVVVGESMAPTLHSGRLIWVDRTYYRTHRPQRGEVVVFRHNGETLVKRIYRGPGERLDYLADGSHCLSLVRQKDAPALRNRCQRMRSRFHTRNFHVVEDRVPQDCLYLLGDNSTLSEDSREFGVIPLTEVIGRASVDVDTATALSAELTATHKRRTALSTHARRQPSHASAGSAVEDAKTL